MKSLNELLATIPVEMQPETHGHYNPNFEALAYDSRQIFEGTGFICLKGKKTDGHAFAAEAKSKGAVALFIDQSRTDELAHLELPMVSVTNTRGALPYLAAAFYDYPTRSFELTGITGTNGKTTTAFMTAAIWKAFGQTTGVVGTVGALVNGTPFPTKWTVSTTPEALDLQQFFAQLRAEMVQHAAIEVTSIAIDQERTAANDFDTAIFTNLTQDHLDYHGSMQRYEAAKAKLFLEYPSAFKQGFVSVLNADDPAGERIARQSEALGITTVRYGINADVTDFRALAIEARADGTHFVIREAAGDEYPVDLPIGGLFNVSNALAATAAARSRGVSIGAVQQGLAALPPVPGRFEPVPAPGKDFHVIVDYAHTPDGLENVLKSARALHPRRLVVVFGCGGNRDRIKRPIMGRIAADLADVVVITSDNPRFEDPEAIVAEIAAGIAGDVSSDRLQIIVDRRDAIHFALCDIAGPGDLIVIAGKGHESYQIVKDQTFPFDDRAVAAEALTRCF